MINNRQKMLLHVYKNAAGINDPTYRNILREKASVSSSADGRMNQAGFEQAMAALETLLFARVDRGEVPDPIGESRWIHEEFYWRNRLPNTGFINSRQAHRIQDLWTRLSPYLSEDNRNVEYLGAILHKATGKKDIGFTALTLQEASCLLDALTDRLAYAVREPESVPF